MAERFRLRISWVLHSFRFCRSKDDAAAAAASAADSPVFRVSAVNPEELQLPHATPPPVDHELRPRHVPAVPFSGCSCGSGDANRAGCDAYGEGRGALSENTPAYLWQKEEKWHVVARVGPSSPRRKIDSDDGGREFFPPLPVRRRPRRTAAGKKKRGSKTKSRTRGSTSSADSQWFSSEDEQEYMEDYDYGDETEVLMSSSRSFSTYSSSSPELNPRLKPIRESPTHQQKEAAPPHSAAAAAADLAARQSLSWRNCAGSSAARRRPLCPSPEEYSSPVARGRSSSVSSVLRKLMMTPLCGVSVDGKVKDSFAVVKRSEDPYSDFRRSMVEMVVENQMYEEGDLEQLLHCFLMLNSHRHHPAIVHAFSDVWATLFPSSHSCTSAVGTPPPPAVVIPRSTTL